MRSVSKVLCGASSSSMERASTPERRVASADGRARVILTVVDEKYWTMLDKEKVEVVLKERKGYLVMKNERSHL
jgi:hypothetical protein